MGDFRYCCSPRYVLAEISTLDLEQGYMDAQPMKIIIMSYFHVKIDKDMNPLAFFSSKMTEF